VSFLATIPRRICGKECLRKSGSARAEDLWNDRAEPAIASPSRSGWVSRRRNPPLHRRWTTDGACANRPWRLRCPISGVAPFCRRVSRYIRVARPHVAL